MRMAKVNVKNLEIGFVARIAGEGTKRNVKMFESTCFERIDIKFPLLSFTRIK